MTHPNHMVTYKGVNIYINHDGLAKFRIKATTKPIEIVCESIFAAYEYINELERTDRL